MPGLELEINGDSKNAQDALNRLTLSFDKFEKAVDKFSTVLNKLDTGLGVKIPAAAKKSSRALYSASTAAKKSGYDFTNLSRVVQDLPFGLIGIQNNLTQLIPGVGILGFAFSGLISAITFSQVGLNNWVRSSKETKEAAEDAKIAQQQMKEAFDSAAQSVIGQADKLKELRNLLVSTAKDSGVLTQAIINQGIAQFLFTSKEKAVQEQLARVIEERFKVEKNLSDFRTREFKPEDFRIKSPLPKVSKQDFNLGSAVIEFENPVAKQLKDQRQESKRFVDQTKQDINSINDIAKRLGLNFSQFVDSAKSAKDPLDDIIDRAKKISSYLNKTTNRNVLFDVDPQLSKSDNAEAAKKFLDKLEIDYKKDIQNQGIRSFEFKLNAHLKFEKVIIDEQTFRNINKLDSQSQKALEKEIDRLLKTNQTRNSVPIELQLGEERRRQGLQLLGLSDPKNDILPQYIKDSITLANTVNGLLTPAFQGLFDAIQQGESPLKAFFQSLGNAVNQLIQKLISAAVQAAILSAIFPGGFGGVKGFSGFFKNILGFAQGGLVSGPTLSLIGEGLGTSRSNPEVVAPLDQLRSMLGDMGGSGNVNVIVTGRIRGNDLALSNARTSRRNSRLGA